MRSTRAADEGRLRELTFASKAHWGSPRDGAALLDHLWVDPAWRGEGLGSLFFGVAADRVRELGAERLEWGAEPNAVGFYEKVGGRFLRDHVSSWGRITPSMGLEL